MRPFADVDVLFGFHSIYVQSYMVLEIQTVLARELK